MDLSLTVNLQQLLKVGIIHLLLYLYYGGAGLKMSDGHLVFTANGANAAGQPTVYWFAINSNVGLPKEPGEEPKEPTKPTEPKAPTPPTITVENLLQSQRNQKNQNHQLRQQHLTLHCDYGRCGGTKITNSTNRANPTDS